MNMDSYKCVSSSWTMSCSKVPRSVCTDHCKALTSTIYTIRHLIRVFLYWQMLSYTDTWFQCVTLLCIGRHAIRTIKKVAAHMTLNLIKDHVECHPLLPIIVGKALGPRGKADLLSYSLSDADFMECQLPSNSSQKHGLYQNILPFYPV